MEKVIHCIWLGGAKTKLAEKCCASWKRFAPDWEVREWSLAREVESCRLRTASARQVRLMADGQDSGLLSLPSYVEGALAAEKWAFVSDWLRFVVLARAGGVYLDYDVELVSPFERLPSGEWCAAEWMKHGEWGYNPGSGIALEAGSSLAQRMLDYYEHAEFGTEKTVGDLMGAILGAPETTRGIHVLKPEVMSPIDWQGRCHLTEETVGVHHYALSWTSPRRRIARWFSWHHMDWLVQLGLCLRRVLR